MDIKEALQVFGLSDFDARFWDSEEEVIEIAEDFLKGVTISLEEFESKYNNE